jgi:hypothetical protein
MSMPPARAASSESGIVYFMVAGLVVDLNQNGRRGDANCDSDTINDHISVKALCACDRKFVKEV